jgi:uncharacterized protein
MLKGIGSSWLQACASHLSVQPRQIEAAALLLKQEATPPFIVRYRADVTGGLDEQQVLAVRQALTDQEALEERRQSILKTLEKKGVANALLSAVRGASDLAELEDLYAPHKIKTNSLADVARSKGLGPLADRIWEDADTPNAVLREAGDDDGVLHLLAERVSQSVEGRATLRAIFWKHGVLALSAPKGAAAKAAASRGKGAGGKGGRGGDGGKGGGGGADLSQLVGSSPRACQLPNHRVLAINRAEAQKALHVAVSVPDKERAVDALCAAALPRPRHGQRAALLSAAARDAYTRLLQPAMARDLRRRLSKQAEAAAARVFAANLASLLMQRPVRGVGAILGVDPGFRSGCKLAVIGPCGNVLDHGTIFPHPPQSESERARRVLATLVDDHRVGVVAVGDGTASQPTIELITQVLREREARTGTAGVRLSVVSEAGASVLSVTAAAKAAEPHLDIATIGAASMARRLQDPLAELVKIDPKSIGVGMYQHDVPEKTLAAEVDDAVQSCVCKVGVDVNTASAALLARVPGLSASRAEAIVAVRPPEGYPSRDALRKVKGIGPKSFEQAAGFLRIAAASIKDEDGGGEPLDCTAVHPESYAAARVLLRKLGRGVHELRTPAGRVAVGTAAAAAVSPPERRAALASSCGVGELAISQIVDALNTAERDARDCLPGPLLLGTDVRSFAQLKHGQRLSGVVRNVTPFGCFVNVGLEHDGLLHVSEMRKASSGGAGTSAGASTGAAVATSAAASLGIGGAFVGQLLDVVVLSVDLTRHRLSLGLPRQQDSGKARTDKEEDAPQRSGSQKRPIDLASPDDGAPQRSGSQKRPIDLASPDDGGGSTSRSAVPPGGEGQRREHGLWAGGSSASSKAKRPRT